jgi:hypothetical protein|tara:strand:+ start:2613 stop:2780 length:168 start_codon:yes stop_codon:yes gene_type:complete
MRREAEGYIVPIILAEVRKQYGLIPVTVMHFALLATTFGGMEMRETDTQSLRRNS